MTDFPIPSPPPELVRQWMERTEYDEHTWFYESYIAEQAARWGADQELRACCVLMDEWGLDGEDLVECRRPRPPSLKEQALMALEDGDLGPGASLTPVEVCIIRRALEQLDD